MTNTNHTVQPCDDEQGRSWDIVKDGVVVHQGLACRGEAVRLARLYDLHDRYSEEAVRGLTMEFPLLAETDAEVDARDAAEAKGLLTWDPWGGVDACIYPTDLGRQVLAELASIYPWETLIARLTWRSAS